MRVISGRAKGHLLVAPSGLETRPTSDKVREAIFDMLRDVVEDASVLDLFAGTGALGIEALSRGAKSAVFVERRKQACEVLKRNLSHTRLTDDAQVLCMPVERAFSEFDRPFDLVFLDPPYSYAGLDGIIRAVDQATWLPGRSVVVFEHTPRYEAREQYERLVRRRYKVYGDTAVSIYLVQEEQDP